MGGILLYGFFKLQSQVSSRAPVWGASARAFGDMFAAMGFQVVPPCGGHPQNGLDKNGDLLVSSRAPVWGASNDLRDIGNNGVVSSRAPVWGASLYIELKRQKGSKFQVVPPCGGHPL